MTNVENLDQNKKLKNVIKFLVGVCLTMIILFAVLHSQYSEPNVIQYMNTELQKRKYFDEVYCIHTDNIITYPNKYSGLSFELFLPGSAYPVPNLLPYIHPHATGTETPPAPTGTYRLRVKYPENDNDIHVRKITNGQIEGDVLFEQEDEKPREENIQLDVVGELRYLRIEMSGTSEGPDSSFVEDNSRLNILLPNGTTVGVKKDPDVHGRFEGPGVMVDFYRDSGLNFRIVQKTESAFFTLFTVKETEDRVVEYHYHRYDEEKKETGSVTEAGLVIRLEKGNNSQYQVYEVLLVLSVLATLTTVGLLWYHYQKSKMQKNPFED